MEYLWPGNVREMQNLVERMVILAEGDRLTMADLPPDVISHQMVGRADAEPVVKKEAFATKVVSRQGSLWDIERAEIEAALRRNGWVQVRAAKELGLTQRQIGYRIKKYGLSRFDSYR